MSNSASQANAFYEQVATSGSVWTIRDGGGFPAPLNSDGIRAMPFWSSLSRAELIIRNVEAYKGFYAVELSWQEFKSKWVPGLEKDGELVGVNWSGTQAKGYDIAPSTVVKNVESLFRSAL